MNEDMLVKVVGCIIIFIPIIEIFTGTAWEPTGLVQRSEKPFFYWLSIICKLAVGIAILNIKYLRAKYGS